MPCNTIVASSHTNYIHPFLHRNFTVREMLRIQSFPDRFTVFGKRAVLSRKLSERKGLVEDAFLDQRAQVGNAVPPLLAKALGQSLIAFSSDSTSRSAVMRALDLFAGCGGLSFGLHHAGFQVVAAAERDDWAVETYRQNFADVEILHGDIREVSAATWRRRFRGSIDLLAGGPPCQGFSISGKRQYGETSVTNRLVINFLGVVEAVRPKAVLLENVGGADR